MVIKDLEEDGNDLEKFLREMREQADKDSTQLVMKTKTI